MCSVIDIEFGRFNARENKGMNGNATGLIGCHWALDFASIWAKVLAAPTSCTTFIVCLKKQMGAEINAKSCQTLRVRPRRLTMGVFQAAIM